MQLPASDSLIDLVALHGELGNSGGFAPGHKSHNKDNFCPSVSAVSELESCAQFAIRSIQHLEMATRHGAQGFRRSLYLSGPEGNAVEFKLTA